MIRYLLAATLALAATIAIAQGAAKTVVQTDETLVGGRTRGEGRGVHHKATVVGAIEVRTRMPVEKSKMHKRAVYAGRLRLRLVPGRGATELTELAK